MKNDLAYFLKELKRHYSFKFIRTFLLFILFLLTPLLFIYKKVEFDPANFATQYLSTVFTSLLIGIVLQIIELFKSSRADYSKVYNLVKSMDSLTATMKSSISNNELKLSIYGELLQHYKLSIFNSFTSDNGINEKLILLYKCEEIEYISESLKTNVVLVDAKKNILLTQLDNLSQKIAQTLTLL